MANKIKYISIEFIEGLSNGDEYTQVVKYGSILDLPNLSNMIHDNETFVGWNCIEQPDFQFGITPITKSLTFEPIWIKNE